MVESRGSRGWALRWVQEGGPRVHVLRAGDDVLARLERVGEATTRGEACGRIWLISHVGFVHRGVVVRAEGSLENIVRLDLADLGGAHAVTLADGERWTFERLSWHGGECCVRDGTGRTMLHVQREIGGAGCGASVVLQPEVSGDRALPLALLCWHVLLLEMDDPARPVSVSNGRERRRSPRAVLTSHSTESTAATQRSAPKASWWRW